MSIKKQLRELKHSTCSPLGKAVITDLLSRGSDEDIKQHLNDIKKFKCTTNLIYYSSYSNFIKHHSNEILKIFEQIKKETGLIPRIRLNNYSFVQFAYREVCKKLSSKLELN